MGVLWIWQVTAVCLQLRAEFVRIHSVHIPGISGRHRRRNACGFARIQATGHNPDGAVRRAVSGLTLVGAAAALATCAFGPDRLRPAAVVIFLLVGLPWCMLRHPRWFRPHGRYRIWGDLSFCLLVIPWIIDGWWSGVG